MNIQAYLERIMAWCKKNLPSYFEKIKDWQKQRPRVMIGLGIGVCLVVGALMYMGGDTTETSTVKHDKKVKFETPEVLPMLQADRTEYLRHVEMCLPACIMMKMKKFDEAAKELKRLASKSGEHSFMAEYLLGTCYADSNWEKCDEEQMLTWMIRSAMQGYAPAQLEVSYRYASGKGLEQDSHTAFRWEENSAKQGYGKAIRRMVRYYKSGNKVQRNAAKEKYWHDMLLNTADNEVDMITQTREGTEDFIYAIENRNTLSKAEQKRYYKQAAQKGLVSAWAMLASIYHIESEDRECIRWCQKVADLQIYDSCFVGKNNYVAGALLILGESYYRGLAGLEVDPKKGYELLLQSASMGDARALAMLGSLWKSEKRPGAELLLTYAAREGQDVSPEKQELYINVIKNNIPAPLKTRNSNTQRTRSVQASSEHDNKAQEEFLSYVEEASEGRLSDDKCVELADKFYDADECAKSFMLYMIAASRGNEDAQKRVERQYGGGLWPWDSTDKEIIERQFTEESRRWFREATEDFDADAQYKMGAYHKYVLQGIIGNVRSLSWWKVAADQGHAGAQYALGEHYYNAWMTNKQPDKQEEILRYATKYLKMAADQGHREAQQLLRRLP